MAFGFSRNHITVGSFVVILASIIWAAFAVGVRQHALARESVPRVGDKSPMFELQGFNLGEYLERGPIVLVFYRGFF